MRNNKVIAKIILQDLKQWAEDSDFDWEAECVPVLDDLIEHVVWNMDTKCVCRLALGSVLGTSKARRAGWKQGDSVG